jgi:hypothetical protein
MTISKNISAQQTRILRDAEVLTDTGTTTASFVDTGSVLDAACYQSVAVTIKNTGGSNGLSWKILASIDGTNYVEVVASANVAFGAIGTGYAVSQAPYRYYKAQVVDQDGASHTTYSLSLIGK